MSLDHHERRCRRRRWFDAGRSKDFGFGLGLLRVSACISACAFGRVTGEDADGTMHTVFSTECNSYFDWQSLGLYDSWRRVGQRGHFTRLMACDHENPPGLDIVPDTHVHPNYAIHPVTRDSYSAYNKPFSIQHWLTHAEVTAEYIIVLDADMIFRTPMTVELLGVRKGAPVSAYYDYLIGTHPENHMGVKLRVPHVEKTQKVGGFTVIHKDDLTKLAPRWLYWTEEVRNDPDSWANTGDIYNQNGAVGAPWISEMYGYVFAAAETEITFQVHDDFMMYPGYIPPNEPFPIVLHYGLTFNVLEYAFSKHWFHGFKISCEDMHLFQKPPAVNDPRLFRAGTNSRRKQDIALHCAWGLYNATRTYAIERCGIENPIDPPKKSYLCAVNSKNVFTCDEERERSDGTFRGENEVCEDKNDACCDWAHNGECTKNPDFMTETCRRSCDECGRFRCSPECCPSDKEETVTQVIGKVDTMEPQRDMNKPLRIENADHGASKSKQLDYTVAYATKLRAEENILKGKSKIEDKLPNQDTAESDAPLLPTNSFAWRRAFVALALIIIIIRIRTLIRRRTRRRGAVKRYAHVAERV